MRWDALALVDVRDERPAIERRSSVRRADGVTFYETRARAAIERMPAGTGLPQRWAVSPYRGCAHACLHCGARGGHRRLGLDAGAGFAAQIVVRYDIAARLRAELPGHLARGGGELAIGVGGDCYQPAEERYRLMPGVLAALADVGAPFVLYTRSPLVLEDGEALREAARACGGRVAVSVAFVDEQVRRVAEPGAPSAQRRLELLAALVEAGVPGEAVMGPILPLLTDSPDQLAATVRRIAATGAAAVTPLVLRLPPGARETYLEWVARAHPALAARHAELYDRSGRPSPAYVGRTVEQVAALARAYGLACGPGAPAPKAAGPRYGQLELL